MKEIGKASTGIHNPVQSNNDGGARRLQAL